MLSPWKRPFPKDSAVHIVGTGNKKAAPTFQPGAALANESQPKDPPHDCITGRCYKKGVAMQKCIKCGKELPPDAVYCPYCGKKQVTTTQQRKTRKRPNGAGTVYKLSGRRRKPWAAARSNVLIGCYATRTEALEALERTQGKDINERYNLTFAQVFQLWSAEHYRDITKAGISTYNRAFDVFETLHNRKFRSLRTSDFQEVIDCHMDKKHSTVSKYKQLITQMSDWAIREEIITKDFATYVRVPEKEVSEKKIFTDDEIQKLENDGSETAKVILMLIYTGMRLGELFSLAVSDCHGDYVVGGEKTDAGRNRVIPIRPEGREYFQYFIDRATGPLLLSGYSGNKNAPNWRKRDYYPKLEELGIEPKNPHTTRHTYASWARSAGVPPEVLQKVLGHADYSTTANIYVHTDPAQLVSAIEKT